ncbi:MAG: hypothetical protein R3C05_28215 [Pirellulaceae bacterium]
MINSRRARNIRRCLRQTDHEGEQVTIPSGLQVVLGGGGTNIPFIDAPDARLEDLFHDPPAEYAFAVRWANDGLNDAWAPYLSLTSSAPLGRTTSSVPRSGTLNDQCGFANFDCTALNGGGFTVYAPSSQ